MLTMNTKALRLAALLAILWGVTQAASAQVQYAGTIYYEYKEKIDQSTNVVPLGADLFGDQSSLENGSTTFSLTDVKAATSVRLPMQLGRSLDVATARGGWSSTMTYNPSADIFGFRWNTEVPYIKGDFLAQYGWVAATGANGVRCSSGNFSLSAANVSSVVVPAHNFFFGNDIKIPGYGTERLLALRADGVRPSDGATYVGTTKSNWKVSCMPSIKNGTGEGFIVTLPDGAKYYFDWMASSATGFLQTSRGNLNLIEGRLYATKAVDRFGGTIDYFYNPSFPHRISEIRASDGAVISVAYHPDSGKISTISTGGGTWHYGYDVNAPNRNADRLATVTLPDTSKWIYGALPGFASPVLGASPCAVTVGIRSSTQPPSAGESIPFLITHPSGAVGEFRFRAIVFGYNRVPNQCSPGSSYYSVAHVVNALYYKSISGPGTSPKTWNIQYFPSWSYAYQCQGCATTANTIVTENSGKVTTYVFGNDYPTNASQLLSKSISGPGVSYNEKYEYLASAAGQPFPDLMGEDRYQLLSNPFLLKNRPQNKTTITLHGRAFVSQVESFDSFVRPVRTIKSSVPVP